MNQTSSHSPGLSRRGNLASVLAAAAAAMPVIASASPHAQDAALLAVSDAFWQIHNEIWSADYLTEHEYGSPEQKTVEAKLEQLCQQEGLLVRQLAQTPARTPAGLKAKATILQSLLPDIMRDCYLSDESAEFLLLMSLLADVAGGAA
ncbi:hypothetical protein ACI01nite_11900 [Acetobacter cibinongensis]|uniref:Twin-arginine translocation pathway signal n=1 Tax=Acetobacter cibinongensis TaxID=146475 RepID=A0A0D6N5E5_9PROT|nr:hypothetical protein [Acetobacter cibinongensis]GAN60915.1 hypothetical protein Abci_017_099 [Acetobacter cibinongensis]GBQ13268.1 hypothetical protein AA0482_0534 [Acetobacter cibinongensis NRIC 0482]GEL58588.1 hypothetical protein ACI01nite_11900 [Acetobacter cibinongensis]